MTEPVGEPLAATAARTRGAHLPALRAEEREKNHAKIRASMLALEAERKPVNITSVARRAGLSRDTVYASPYRQEIERLRVKTADPVRASVQATRTEDSLRRQLRDAQDEIQRLRGKVKKLEVDLAAVVVQVMARSTR